MQYLTKRREGILSRLNEDLQVITSSDLALSFNVSTRTVKNDVSEINAVIQEYGALIESRLGKGYQLTIKDRFLFDQYNHAVKAVEYKNTIEVPQYRYERINYIIKKLLAIDYYISAENLISELYVSATTLNTDLKEVKSILSEYGLSIETKPKFGIILKGDEIGKRLCIAEYYFHSAVSTGFFAADHAMFVSTANKIELQKITAILKEVVSEFNLNISDASFQNFVIHICIAIRRWKFYNYVKMTGDKAKAVVSYHEYPAGKRLKEKLEEWQNIILPNEEALYFTLHFHSKHLNEIEELTGYDQEFTGKVIAEICQLLSQKYHIENLNISQFEKYLSLHIPVMVERLRTGMVIRNAEVYKTIGNYPLAAFITCDISSVIENRYQVKMNINEYAYLILYANLLIINSLKNNKRILLLCCQGRPEMATIINEINEYLYHWSADIDICDFYKLDTVDLSKYSLLITTIKVAAEIELPQVVLSSSRPFYIQIKEAIDNASYNNIDLPSFFKPQYCINHLAANDKSEVLKRISKLFVNAGEVYHAISSSKQEMVLETNKKIVFLHSNMVIPENFILMVTLKKPIIWKNQWIQIVFWVNAASLQLQELFLAYHYLNEKTKRETAVQKLLNAQSTADLIELMTDSESR